MKRCLLIALVATLSMGQRPLKETIENLPEGGTFTDPKTGTSLTMHRRGAGSRDSMGWYSATSLVPCGFQVNMPGPYNDFTQSGRATDGAMVKIHTVAARTVDGATFTVTCTERSDGKIPRSLADDLVNGLRSSNPDLRQRKAMLAGADGVEYSMHSSQSGQMGRIAVIGSRAYLLIIEYPWSEEKHMPDVAKVFFESFELR